MERYIAIDNVCAWPNLLLLPDGRIVALIFNQPCHGQWEGDVECWESRDGGRLWTLRGVPAPHDPGTVRMNVAAGLAWNGDLVVLVTGWGGAKLRGHILPTWVCRSEDGGRTWNHSETFPVPSGQPRITTFGQVLQLARRELGVAAYGFDPTTRAAAAWFFTSEDDGRTWGRPVRISDGFNETAVLRLGDERILAAARSAGGGGLTRFVSEDFGRTWTRREPLTGVGEFPGHLLRLGDGAILLTYGIRHHGLYGIGSRLSRDCGETWTKPMFLAGFDDAVDGGYPSSVELPDQTLVTAYYTSGVPAHNRYHMGVIRWRIEEMLARNRQVRPIEAV